MQNSNTSGFCVPLGMIVFLPNVALPQVNAYNSRSLNSVRQFFSCALGMLFSK